MKNRVLVGLLVFVLVALPLLGACSAPQPQPSTSAPSGATQAPSGAAPGNSAPVPAQAAKDKIRIGWASSFSGPMASGVASTNGPIYEMWVEEVNAAGGIYVKQYDKKLPIELIKYDDKSDMGTMTKLLEKLILEDKVDFILPPWSTGFLYAAAPIANKYGYILIGGPGGALQLKELKLPYFFQTLNFADTQMTALADLFQEMGVKRVGIIYIADLHGIEYSGVLVPELKKRGIEVVMNKSYPPGAKDLSPELKEAMAANVDGFASLSYPDETFLVTGQAMEIGFNPKVFEVNVGGSFPAYRDNFTAAGVEGIISPGGFNAKTSPGAKTFIETFTKRWGQEPEYWGTLFYYASMQFFQQAIEKAGTLDQAKIRDIMATDTFDTAMGPMKFVDGINVAHPGEMNQWQNGVFEVIAPKDKRTAQPIYPKPAWPKR